MSVIESALKANELCVKEYNPDLDRTPERVAIGFTAGVIGGLVVVLFSHNPLG